MKTFHTIKNIIIVFAALGLTFLLLGFIEKQRVHAPKEIPVEEEVPVVVPETSAHTSLHGVTLFIDIPKENEIVQSPLMLSGRAPGNWFFEASAPVTITNWDGLIIGESYITAQGDWMTTDYVPFTGTLSFTNTEYGDYGFIIFRKDNASGEPQFDDAVEFKVMFR